MEKKTVKLAIAAVISSMASTAALADLVYKPEWPHVKCRLQGKKFQYNPTGNAPNYAAAAEKCKAYGGEDNGPAIIGPRPRDGIK